MGKLSLRRRGTVAGAVVLAGILAAGGATAYAATSSSPAKSTSTAAAKAKAKHHRHAPRGVHGQVTVKNGKTGQYVTREWQRGQVTAVSGTTLTVKSADGTTWTWTADPKLKITRDGKKTTESVLASGDTVLVEGNQAGSVNDATRIYAPSAAQIAKWKAKAAQK
ncbi:uncharacterized protein (UPF0333 family) [Streptacidiphilus sp. MAP12-16]|uniref:DUF5666 domain-containing protein n=1 Tax=Streptacidiphilus sp. MAP12-16 TaxID=3156300 RepID=UPI00351563F7